MGQREIRDEHYIPENTEADVTTDCKIPYDYFGTDGVRARVGDEPMMPETVLKFGWASGRSLCRGKGKALIGKDTRISGYMFESALEAGLSAAGIDVHLLGPLPTPGVACLTLAMNADLGFIISASHNSYHDNGLKLFSAQGTKLTGMEETQITESMSRQLQIADRLGKAHRIGDAVGRYTEFCKGTIRRGMNFRGLRIAVDCAHGAAYIVAPQVFYELGATVFPIGVSPDGFNINADVGALHPRALQRTVQENNADIGIALDGDGDRLIMVDDKGEVIDGDEILMIIAAHRLKKSNLYGVVGTQMSNIGLERGLTERGVVFERTQVGDRYVIERLLQKGWQLGGETSGHIICLDKLPTGDGIVAALQVIQALIDEQTSLSSARKLMTKYPQKMVNVPCNAAFCQEMPELAQVTQAAQSALGDCGRVVVRPSGTEPLVRIMVEAESSSDCDKWAREIAQIVSKLA